MKLSSQIKPISYLKAHAAEIVRNMGDQGAPLVITQNGEAKVVLQRYRKLRANPGNHGPSEDSCPRQPSNRGRRHWNRPPL